MSYDPTYLRGIEHFNKEEFFEAHETWERLWHKANQPDKDFLKGLIQAAVALHHLKQGNKTGANYLYQSCHRLLESYGKSFMGLNIDSFVKALDNYFKEPEKSKTLKINLS